MPRLGLTSRRRPRNTPVLCSRTRSGNMGLGRSMRPCALTPAASSRTRNATRAGSAASRRATLPVCPQAYPTTTAPVRSLTLGTTLMRTFRAPSLEELFSEGPHLAAYSYEVGNGSLDSERGLGLGVVRRLPSTKKAMYIWPFFRNAIDGYIFPKEQRRAQSEARRSLSLPDSGGARPHARCRSQLRLACG